MDISFNMDEPLNYAKGERRPLQKNINIDSNLHGTLGLGKHTEMETRQELEEVYRELFLIWGPLSLEKQSQ